MNQIIDFDKRGNQVRFYLGTNGKQWGDDWDDAPYEHNAERVYGEFVKDTKVINFDFDDIVLEPADGHMNSSYTKEDMINRKIPCIVVIDKKYFADDLNFTRWEIEENFDKALKHPHAKKYYFGDQI